MKNNTLGRLYQDGEIIIKQGTVGDCLYVIQEGRVAIYDESGDVETKVAELGEKEFFGEMGLFEKDVRSATVRAFGESRKIRPWHSGFLKVCHGDFGEPPENSVKWQKRLNKRFGNG